MQYADSLSCKVQILLKVSNFHVSLIEISCYNENNLWMHSLQTTDGLIQNTRDLLCVHIKVDVHSYDDNNSLGKTVYILQ